MDTLYELGERCFNELINRGLIQPWDINRYWEVPVCRVHDTILDFIVYKSVEENFVTYLEFQVLLLGHITRFIDYLSSTRAMEMSYNQT